MLRITTFALGLATLCSGPVLSETYYIAPPGTVSAGIADGSQARPFVGLLAAFDSGKVKGGDKLLLKDGKYGSVDLRYNVSFDSPVVIQSETDRNAHFDWIQVAGDARNLTFVKLGLWPSDPAAGRNYLFRTFSGTADITIDDFDIRGELNASQFMDWDAAKWNARKYSGILIHGSHSTAIRNTLTGVNLGIDATGPDARVINNVVNGFSGDALRAGSGGIVSHNKVSNCVQVDTNHLDGFQAFAGTGAITNLTIDSNVILEWTGNQANPVRCGLQGIGLFDGFYDNLVITNNVVSVTAYHGISVLGARGAKIVNNTVVHALGHTKLEPWIGVFNHKNGTPSTDVLVANNVAMRYMGSSDLVNRIEFRSNSVVGTPGAVFEGPSTFDYRPRVDSGLVDTADKPAAPPVDLLGLGRPSGNGPDRGAYELQVAAAPAPTNPVPTPTPTPTPTDPVPTPTDPVPTPTDPVVTPPAPEPIKPAPVKPAPTKPKPTKPGPKATKGDSTVSGTAATTSTAPSTFKTVRLFMRRAFIRVFGR